MAAVVRTLTVSSVDPGISDPTRVHAVIAMRDAGGVVGALHLFTGDPVLVACLAPGAELELRAALPGEAPRG